MIIYNDTFIKKFFITDVHYQSVVSQSLVSDYCLQRKKNQSTQNVDQLPICHKRFLTFKKLCILIDIRLLKTQDPPKSNLMISSEKW